jgi:hypothetical protein
LTIRLVISIIILTFISCGAPEEIPEGKKEVIANFKDTISKDTAKRSIASDTTGKNLVGSETEQLKIEIHDNQYDCYNSMEYYLTSNSLYIDNYSEHGDMYDANYKPEALLDKVLSKSEMQKVKYFIAHFPYDSLKTLYASGLSKECDKQRQINININYNGNSKNIQIEDCYQKDIAKLFDLINFLLPKGKKEQVQIEYMPSKFECKL